jgi:hypothetical protein
MTADQDVDNAGNGTDGTAALPYALVAMLYDANLLGLGKDYAYPETANTTSSRWDQITTLAKVLTRTHTHADGNTYDLFDAVQTCLKWVLSQNLHINDDEVNSVNHVKQGS